MPSPVELYVYDLSNGLAMMYGAALTGQPIEGIWHTSLVLYGMEVFYGQGISIVSPPGTTHHGMPKKRIPCGETQLDKQTFLEYIEGLKQTYTADAYHLLAFNCNSFTQDVLGFLSGRSIPADIRDQPKLIMSTPFGQSMRPMIEQMYVGRRAAGTVVGSGASSEGVSPAATGTTTPIARPQTNPSAQSLSSNLRICTSAASLRTTLSTSPATAVMFTSPTCPPCTAIKPFFEDLARKHGAIDSKKRMEFVLVETGVGEGAGIARNSEFGGPVQATPAFVFFSGARKVGECKGADRMELETQVQLLEMEAFPAHPHTKLSLPALEKLSKNLAPVTYTAFPPLPTLADKLSSVLSSTSLDSASKDVLTERVISYLSTLPAPPSPAPTAPIPSDLLEPWLSASLSALSAFPSAPSSGDSKFPIVDLLRLALARDSLRLSSQPAFLTFLPTLLSHLASDLDHDTPSRPYLLTSLRLVSNTLTSPALTARILAPDCLPSATRLIIRALLDPEDAKLRAAGAGLAWSVVARVHAARIGESSAAAAVEGGKVEEHAIGGKSETEEGGGEEWEGEVAAAVVEALQKETESVEVVHRLTATLGLLLYQSPYFSELYGLLEAVEAHDVLSKKRETVEKLAVDAKEKDGVLDVLEDVETLLGMAA
ncbi:hypothetical protein JCM8547_002742 [Rhodosporidiobolus lusitaniae]